MTTDTLTSNASGQEAAGGNTDFWDRPENIIHPDDTEWAASEASSENDYGQAQQEETPTSQSADPNTAEANSREDRKAPNLSDVKDPEVRTLMAEEAKKRGLNLDDPREREFARQFAEAQNQIRKLKLGSEPSDREKSYLSGILSKFEEQQPEAKETPASKAASSEKPAPAEAANLALPTWAEQANRWNDPTDFTEDLLAAYESQDKGRISDTYMAFHHKMMMDYMPLLQQQIAEAVTTRLGPLAQEAEVMQSYEVNNQVISVMKADPDFSEIERIFDNASNGTVTVSGQQVPDTWVNRILSRNPMIEFIQVDGKTKSESDRKTRAAKYAAIYEEFQRMRGQIDSSKAKDLVQAGRVVEKTRRDPVRQSINSGRTGVPAAGKPSNPVRDIVGYRDGAMTVHDLFR